MESGRGVFSFVAFPPLPLILLPPRFLLEMGGDPFLLDDPRSRGLWRHTMRGSPIPRRTNPALPYATPPGRHYRSPHNPGTPPTPYTHTPPFLAHSPMRPSLHALAETPCGSSGRPPTPSSHTRLQLAPRNTFAPHLDQSLSIPPSPGTLVTPSSGWFRPTTTRQPIAPPLATFARPRYLRYLGHLCSLAVTRYRSWAYSQSK